MRPEKQAPGLKFRPLRKDPLILLMPRDQEGTPSPAQAKKMGLAKIAVDGPARVKVVLDLRAGFGAQKLRRLAALKHEWDPDNLFRGNHNVRPATAG